MIRRYANLLLTLLFIVAVGPTISATAQTQSVNVGCLYPLTGPDGLYGRDSVIAIQMAKEYVHSRVSEGYPLLDVMIEDTRSKSLRSVQIAQKFIEENQADFLCGVVRSPIARAVSKVAKMHETFFIGTDHASPTLVTEALHPYYFRVSNGARQSVLAGAKYIAEHYPSKEAPLKIAFIGPDYEYGYQAWDDLRAFLTKEGVQFQIAGEFWPKVFETDYTLYIQQLLKSDVDIVVSGQWGLDVVTFVRQASQQKLFQQMQFMNFDAGGNYEILAELGSDMPTGLVLSGRHHLSWPPSEQNAKFVQDFYERAGRYPSYAAQGAYTGILAIAEAVRQAGGKADKDKVRAALRNLRLKLPEDPEGFQSFMDPKTHQLMQVQAIGKTMVNNEYPPAAIQLGEWRIYYPPESWPVLDARTPAE